MMGMVLQVHGGLLYHGGEGVGVIHEVGQLHGYGSDQAENCVKVTRTKGGPLTKELENSLI